ncbi:MAG: sugar nucleotide-binding protein [Anaerolineae bacterium]|nr:sugar nucleotide-binding protein [Anaerolineae bacterium]
MNRRILVIGGSGFVGSRLVALAASHGYDAAYTFNRAPLPFPIPAYPLDLNCDSDASLVASLVAVQPDVVVHCAVPPLLSDLDLHTCVSVTSVQRLIRLAEDMALSFRLIYLSTNAVFSGDAGPYRETDVPNAHLRAGAYRAYGMARALGEQVALTWPDALVARTAWVDGRTAAGDLSPRLAGLVRQLRRGQSVPRFTGRMISPTLLDNLVAALYEAAAPTFDFRGMMHIAGAQRLSDYDYARAVALHLGVDPDLVCAQRLPDHGLPRDLTLDVTHTQSLLQTRLLPMAEQLASLAFSD